MWLGWRLWRALALDRFCEDRLIEGRERSPWPAIAAILVIARLCEPSSELHIAEDWYRRTALDDLLGVPAERVNDDRLYRALDRLLPHKQALETHLKERLGALFDLDYELLLYDVTSTYFEGRPRAMGPLAAAIAATIGETASRFATTGGDAGRRPARLRGVRRQSHRRDDNGGDRHHDGAPLWSGAPRVGDGPRHGER